MTASPASLVKVKSGAKSPSRTKTASPRRAVGVVRVSRVGDRSGEQFVSPTEQAERIRSACARDGLKLVKVVEELDVSGGASLGRRPGLSSAIALVEEHKADVLVVAFFDQLVRSLKVQAEVVERVEAAGGKILASGTSGLDVDRAQVMLKELGIKLDGKSPFKTTYIRFGKEIAQDIPPTDHVMYEPGLRVTPLGRALSLLWLEVRWRPPI